MLNLLTNPWIPVRRAYSPAIIAPAQLTEALDTDPILALDWPRADFRAASLEFLTGLLATCCPPADAGAWLDWWETPPTAEQLAAAFAPFAHAFALDGDGPRFLQDAEAFGGDDEPVERLLIDAPGDSTVKKNTDLLVHRGQLASLGRPAAAMALYTLQSWAPSGGAGNRTGLRGGGPLVTMVLPRRRSLWHLLWANVPQGAPPAPDALPRVFPWLAATLTSKDGRVVTPEDGAHPLQCWWGMPRRIRLVFEARPGPCGLTGVADGVAVTGWRQRPHGANYAAWGSVHPLTPTYQLKPGTEKLPLHPQPGGIGYRHWLGLVLATGDGVRQPAPVIQMWRDGRAADAQEAEHSRLLAAGFDMDNMKARGLVESEMPLPGAADADTQAAMDALARRLVGAAEQVAGLLRMAVRNALFSAGANVKLDAEMLASLRERLWDRTESGFFAALEQAAVAPEGIPGEGPHWRTLLHNVALALFDEAAPLDPDAPPALHQGEGAPRQVRARRNLRSALSGYGPAGTALFTALEIPAPPQKARPGREAAA